MPESNWVKEWKRKVGKRGSIRALAASKTVLHVVKPPNAIGPEAPNYANLPCADDLGNHYNIRIHHMTLDRLLDLLTTEGSDTRFMFRIKDIGDRAPLVFIDEVSPKTKTIVGE